MEKSAHFDALQTHIQALRRYAYGLCRDRYEAEDLVQECLSRAIASANSLRPGAPLKPWLFRILHNVHISQVRQRQVRGPVHDPDEADGAVAADQMASLELRDVLAALELLPSEQRDAVLLMAVEDLPYRDAADALGVPLGTFMSRLSRGRQALRVLTGEDRGRHLRIVRGGQ
ncbi:RNA polymerase sigma-70 factor (ECF subfamily) [Natronocella acetinitrilica]|uniref:RNA polymerase sigma-70 factor (ECF subfamily) n=1 Tax=Natronocella acetinitrilica TaxID=414046 RepID=A0AAE3G2Y0_9GAMM|nr:sigma-70 family RNA polymerase sigma factor [Natronocella acetinitrilica]MCP1674835.1 RNA polymerase sigma-70 factor (ECF subfamily) [Natronocella acetinitrilica]